jgi:PRTRC genetic system ThiF family protein
MTLSFDPHLHPRQIVLVGVGGTGGHLARLIARTLAHLRSLRLAIPALILVDPDTVEAKNVGRQLYAPSDLGAPKAELSARRLSSAFGLAIEWSNQEFSASDWRDQQNGTIFIDAVDNHTARRELASLPHATIIACGNHRQAGQVAIGNQSDPERAREYLREMCRRANSLGKPGLISQMPNAYALFPQLLEPEEIAEQPEVSCAELLAQGEQDLLINDAIALMAARYLQMLLLRQPITSFLSFLSLENGLAARSIPITFEDLTAYLP